MPIQETFFASRFGQLRDRFGINWMIMRERPMPPVGRSESESSSAYSFSRKVSDSVTCLGDSGNRYGPENPIGTPPGARTIATVTPSITRVGDIISSAPSCSAFA